MDFIVSIAITTIGSSVVIAGTVSLSDNFYHFGPLFLTIFLIPSMQSQRKHIQLVDVMMFLDSDY